MKNNYKEMKNEELQNEVKELKRELFKIKFQHATNQLSNPKQITAIKKNIARVHTELTQRQLKEQKS